MDDGKHIKAPKFIFKSDFSNQWFRAIYAPKLFSKNKFWLVNVVLNWFAIEKIAMHCT